MAEFEFQGRDQEGKPISGRIEADGAEQALAKLAEQGLFVDLKDITLLVGEHEDAARGRHPGRDDSAGGLRQPEKLAKHGCVRRVWESSAPFSA
jgi:hypothetical protein